jgi:translation initiation factor IF-2
LSVPLQAVVLDKGKPPAFDVKGKGYEQPAVEVGRSNDTRDEILAGLKEGEEVLLAPPAGFMPQGAPAPTGESADAATAEMGPPAMMPPGADGGARGAPGAEGGAPRGEGAAGDRPRGNRRPRSGDGAAGQAGGAPGGAREGGAPRDGAGAPREGGAPRDGAGAPRDGACGARDGGGAARPDGGRAGGAAPTQPAESGTTTEKPGGKNDR